MKILSNKEYERLMNVMSAYKEIRQDINDVEEGQKVAYVHGHEVVIISEDYFKELVMRVVKNGVH